MLQIYEKRADNVVQKRVFLIFLGLLLMQTLAFAQSDKNYYPAERYHCSRCIENCGKTVEDVYKL